MLGKILRIENKNVIVENLNHESIFDVIGYYVVFENKKSIVGEIKQINDEELQVLLIGEIKNSSFVPGIDSYPNANAKCRFIYKNELESIIGTQNYNDSKTLLLGNSTTFENFKITVNLNDLLSNHFAAVGNTGGGKSCAIARMIQNLFVYNKPIPFNSHIILFDAYGEYVPALSKINIHEKINVKFLGMNKEKETLNIPPYLLDADDLAILLNVDDSSLVPILEKTLTYVFIFKSNTKKCQEYQNDIIAKTVFDIVTSGKRAEQIRDQVLAFLSKFNTEDLNLESIIKQPGYNRTIRQCLNIDNQGKIQALELLVNYVKQFSEIAVEQIATTQTFYTLEDIYNALEFALISEGTILNEKIYEKMNNLKTRLYQIINSNYKSFFEMKENLDIENYIKKMFLTSKNEKVQLIDISLEDIEDRFAKIIIKLLSKIIYKFSTSNPLRASYPINILVEEAHRYIQNDNDIYTIGYNIFDRIAKEGRKYGVLLGLITQRLSELSTTTLSQCSNFIVFKMFYPQDINTMESISSNLSKDIIERVKTLHPGTCLLFGNAFKIPLIAKFDLPNPMPKSTNANIVEQWYKDSF